MKLLSYIRRFFIWTLLLFVAVYYLMYILLSINVVQSNIAQFAEKHLSSFLETDVKIEKIKISPFNKASLVDIVIYDQKSDTLFYADKVNTSIRLYDLIDKKITLNSVTLYNFCINTDKENIGDDINAKFLIDKFKPKRDRKRTIPKISINTLLLQNGTLRYDILNAPYKGENIFDKNHISINDILLNASVKGFTTDSINVNLRTLRFVEKSGFKIKDISFKLIGNEKSIKLKNFSLLSKQSKIFIKENKITMPDGMEMSDFMDMAEFDCGIDNGSIVMSDFAPFVPILKDFNTPTTINCKITGSANHLMLDTLGINYDNGGLTASGYGSIDNIFPDPKNAFLFGNMSNLSITSKSVVKILNDVGINLKDYTLIHNIGKLSFNGEISGFVSKLVTYGKIKSNIGNISADVSLESDNGFKFNGGIKSNNLKIDKLIPDKGLGDVAFDLKLDGKHSKLLNKGKVKGEIALFEYNNYKYNNIAIDAWYNNKEYNGSLSLNDSNIVLNLNGMMNLGAKRKEFALNIKGDNIRLNDINLTKKYEGSVLSFDIDANFKGDRIDNADGIAEIKNLSFKNNGEEFTMQGAYIEANNSNAPQYIALNSDIIAGNIIGDYKFSSLKNSLLGVMSEVMPSFIDKVLAFENHNSFEFEFSIPDTENLTKTFELPFMFNNTSYINGYYNDSIGRFSVITDIPAFSMGKIFLGNSNISVEKFGSAVQAGIRTTHITPKGIGTEWDIEAIALNDSCSLNIDWSNTKNKKVFSGNFSTTSHFISSEDGNLIDMIINPSYVIISDSIWDISHSNIHAQGKEITIHDFEINHNGQFLKIDGDISPDKDKDLNISLKEIDLSFIFDVLNRKNIVFGGEATGDINISNIYSGGMPIMKTNGLFVKDFSYNRSIFGDLNVESKWDDIEKAICFDGDVSQPDIKTSKVIGKIMPTRDSLYFYIDAHKLSIDFLQPFTQKIMSGVTGKATGVVEFFGRFKALNVVSNAYAENFSFGIDYLNTRFFVTDSVKLDRNGVWLNNVTVKDSEGHTGKVNMALRYKNFRNMTYDISMFDMSNFLVFNVTEKMNPVYYGTVYGTGSGRIWGDAENTTIDVNMITNPNSNFTFVLRDEEDAGDYGFITFVDKDAVEIKDVEVVTERPWEKYSNIKLPEKKHKLAINLQIDATRDAMMRMVIDPNTNDQIKAWGEGGVRVAFETGQDLKIFGSYTAEKGSYSLNLQDLISKDFVVDNGSTITFTGDPMKADLNINAHYNVQANLLDLDESFAHENELNRTTVPVHTTLNLTGNLQKPEFTFDLKFPTLSQNIYRRVKTIINSEDMMNRQVIYLLALNKFYTPEYMSVSERHNNELAAVASSALSSQLNNILGQISDKFNIGTNFRSDKGDFTDLEFDVVLTSQLLNNRLIFNGNLGYRDKSVSNSSFIGDFDLEYLINKSGTFRLKAYNHYNDKNYYIKSALTTQGVGLMFKKDFNKTSEIFKRNPDDVAYEKAQRDKRKKRREERKNKNNDTSIEESESKE